MRFIRSLTLIVTTALLACPAHGDTDTVLILHTNDLHDHVRPGYNGLGGLPYVSGYIKSVLAQRDDALVLDGGDVMEKGDLLAFKTQSVVMYEALGKAGYDAVAVGNHDVVYGLDHLRSCERQGNGLSLLCLNLVKEDMTPYFTPSKVFDVDGVKVGVIGLTVPRGEGVIDIEKNAQVLAKEAERLEPKVHLLVVLCHLGTGPCSTISHRVPAIDVFVGGHSHEVVPEPRVEEGTGALIVQAGDYARYVGRLELTIDLDTEQIVKANGGLVQMGHDAVPCDTAMATWVRQREQEVCPEAAQVIGRTERPLTRVEAARLAAAALRQHGGADVGFCHPGKVMRSGLPEGRIDVNALFVTGGQKGHALVAANLTGDDVVAYMKGLAQSGDGDTQWAGFRYAARQGNDEIETDLKAAYLYRVVLTRREWDATLGPFLAKRAKARPASERQPAGMPTASACPFAFIDALAAYVEARSGPLDEHVEALATAQGL